MTSQRITLTLSLEDAQTILDGLHERVYPKEDCIDNYDETSDNDLEKIKKLQQELKAIHKLEERIKTKMQKIKN
jgi:flagellar biosynthesis chaperone FliJ